MKKTTVILLVVILVATQGFRRKPAGSFNVPDGWPKPAYNFRKNPLSDKKIQLGRLLFYDPVLSRDSTISCASCHSPSSAFTHVDHNLSHGIEGKMGTRNSPALMNLAWSKSFMWDGAVAHLDEQAVKPISNPLEMDESLDNVVRKLRASGKYASLFRDAFEDSAITGEYVLKSLSQFMLTIVSANAKYDKVQRGEEQFTENEAAGYTLFQKDCGSCHKEPLFTNGGFENNGLVLDDALRDVGQMKVTGKSSDPLKFKVPTLRNVQYSAPYMHDGRFKSLSQVLNNYVMGVCHGPTLSPKLQKGIYLTAVQKNQLMAFLYTLSDKQFLSDPRYGYPAK